MRDLDDSFETLFIPRKKYLDTRLIEAIKKENIITIRQLLLFPGWKLIAHRYLGPKSERRLRDVLGKFPFIPGPPAVVKVTEKNHWVDFDIKTEL